MQIHLRVCFTLLCGLNVSCQKKAEDDSTQSERIFPFRLGELVLPTIPDSLRGASEIDPKTAWYQMLRKVLFEPSDGQFVPMLVSFDRILNEVEDVRNGMDSDPECISSEPASRSILAPDFEVVPLNLQCFLDLDTSSFIIWGKSSEGTYSLYTRDAQTISLARISPSAAGSFDTKVYISHRYLDGEATSGMVVHFETEADTKTFKLTFAGPDEVCGARLTVGSTDIQLEGSVSTSNASSCPPVQQGRFSIQDFTEIGGFNGSSLFSESISFRRIAGSQKSGGFSRAYQEYANQLGSGNINLMQVTNPNIGGRDLNFGPMISDELLSASFRK